MKVGILVRNILVGWICLLLIAQSGAYTGDKTEQIRAYTRAIEFDYISWTLKALGLKITQNVVDTPQYLSQSDQRNLVFTQLKLVQAIDQTNSKIERIYANPQVLDPARDSAGDYQQLQKLIATENNVQPIAEMILQQQVSSVLAENNLTLGGQPIPPVLFHSTPLPMALIISPRDAIRQDANISLVADLTIPQTVALEKDVEKNLNVSALVVPIGGVGIYPTMVMNTTDLPWLAEVISHEWTHNFLTLRPLGINYDTSPELRTINETTASIIGKEIGSQVIQQFYPEALPPAPRPEQAAPKTPSIPAPKPVEPPPFDYREEMHQTRVKVDQLLAEEKINEAEDYMEMQRRVFWDHGYEIRRLNQAYFAFYGAYADVPGGAAGTDPVGPAVRELRAQSKSLADFLNRISWITSFDQLKKALRP
jgi:hypothetical protein